MMNYDILRSVRKSLEDDTGRLRSVSEVTGIPYDTILRIKNGEGDPGYSKVKAVFDYYAAKVGAGGTAKEAA
jgi:predicted transcriptional regulator